MCLSLFIMLGSHRFYDQHKFASDRVRQDPARVSKLAKLFCGSTRRKLRCKQPEGAFAAMTSGRLIMTCSLARVSFKSDSLTIA